MSLKQIRSLTLALFVSGGLNIAMAGFLVYGVLQERPVVPYCEVRGVWVPPPIALPEHVSAVQKLRQLSYQQLVQKLGDTSDLGGGVELYSLALGLLVQEHYLDIARAIQPSPQGKWLLGEEKLLIYPLTEGQRIALYSFLAHEPLPFTSQGLFERAKQDPTVRPAFHETEEYRLVEALLGQDQTMVWGLLQQLPWSVVASAKTRASQGSLSMQKERFLEDALKNGASMAVRAWVQPEKKSFVAVAQPPRLSPQPPSPPKPQVYTVATGDTLWKIAKRFGISADQLRKDNHLTGDTLKPGAKLFIYPKAGPFPPGAKGDSAKGVLTPSNSPR